MISPMITTSRLFSGGICRLMLFALSWYIIQIKWGFLNIQLVWVTLFIVCLLFRMHPCSCDTFVALPPSTEGERIIFGKNSDRPCDEVQEVVYFPARDYGAGEKVEVATLGKMHFKNPSQHNNWSYLSSAFCICSLLVHIHWDWASSSHICSGSEQTSVALGSRNGSQWTSGLHWKWGSLGKNECRWWRGTAWHGSC